MMAGSTWQYAIARHEEGCMELFCVSLGDGNERVLPIFSSRMLARGFLWSNELVPEWRIRETSGGELVSLLLGLYTEVGWVLPNPLPKPFAAEEALLNLVDRGSFVRFLLAPWRDLQTR